jgi:hypothetical protein
MQPKVLRKVVSRRGALSLIAAGPLAGLLAACGGDGSALIQQAQEVAFAPEPTAAPEPPPPPFVVPEGEQKLSLMAGTIYETPLYVFGSGQPGPVLAVLGGVHGNEPGGWFAADRLLETLRPSRGAFLIVPRANRLADAAFVRTTDQMGDLNRLYPGNPDGLPMAQMAAQITEKLRDFHATLLIDMHESWAFFYNRPQNGTAYLGQTVATSQTEPGITLARESVEAVNSRILYAWERLYDRNNPNNPQAQNGSPPTQGGGNNNNQGGIPNAGQSVPGGTSSLGLPRHVPGLSTLLVEMGQQQDLSRRIALHVDLVGEVSLRMGLRDA